MRSRATVVIAAWGLLVFASADPVAADGGVPMPESWAWHSTPSNVCPVVSESLARAAAASLAVGPGASAKFSRELTRFRASPTAVAEARAAHAYAVARRIRTLSWVSVYLATFIRSEEAVGFLRDVAVAPVVRVLSERNSLHADEPGWSDFQAQLAAVRGIAEAFSDAQERGRNAVMDVISQGASELSRMLAVELFVRDRLSAEIREIVESRGISTQFRSLSGEAIDELDAEGVAYVDPFTHCASMLAVGLFRVRGRGRCRVELVRTRDTARRSVGYTHRTLRVSLPTCRGTIVDQASCRAAGIVCA